jgi:hypothetical protein
MWAHADEATAMCALVNSTDITSIKGEWNCDNIENICNWEGVTCQDGYICKIELKSFGISGKISHMRYHLNHHITKYINIYFSTKIYIFIDF